jgi:butyryl-CoA dehydrogenase
MQFYFKYELPKTTGLAEVLMDKQALTLNTENQVFA